MNKKHIEKQVIAHIQSTIYTYCQMIQAGAKLTGEYGYQKKYHKIVEDELSRWEDLKALYIEREHDEVIHIYKYNYVKYLILEHDYVFTGFH